jgi:hypothetical protein
MILESTTTLRKANVVADALSRRTHANQLVVRSISFELCDEFDKLSDEDWYLGYHPA